MIFTDSAFFYLKEVTTLNRLIAFKEGGGQITAILSTGRYTLTTYLNEILRAMNDVGGQIYSGSLDRQNRLITISAPGTFQLLVATGTGGQSAFFDMGFVGSDRTGASSYSGGIPVGYSYRPQFKLQNFTDFDDLQRAIEPSYNRATSGQGELIRFGVDKIMECSIEFITDIDQGGVNVIRTNKDGVDDARAFMEYAVTKGPMEFVPDFTDPDEFRSCILESTPESRDGVDFKLKEQYLRGLTGYYSTGVLTFREVAV